jgi:two-component system NtrC family sensor kinase
MSTSPHDVPEELRPDAHSHRSDRLHVYKFPSLLALKHAISSIHERFRHSFRYKLLLLVLLPLLLFIPLILIFTLHRSYAFAQAQLYQKIHSDINVAVASFQQQQNKYLQAVTQLAESHAFYTAMQAKDKTRIQNLLQTLKLTDNLDFAHVVDLHGRWLYDDTVFSGEVKPSPLIADVIHSGLPRVGLEVYSPVNLLRERQSLINKARITPLVGKPADTATSEQRALIMRAVYPIRNTHGQTVALLEGGVMLNDNASLIDAIHDLVYGPGTLPEDGKGMISVVLDNVRVATDLQTNSTDGQLALGSQIPSAVYQQVLKLGNNWAGEVRTPGGVYLCAYQPIRDFQGNIIGMVEAGYLAAPLRMAYQRDLVLLGLLLLLIIIVTTVLAIYAARRMFKPIERIAEVIRAQEHGDDQRIGEIHSRDEIGAVARRFDHMLDLLHERNAQIQRAADELERQVQERTHELQRKNTDLQTTIDLLCKTRQQLVWAEKFAALGELTAGIAHELNNPTAVILGNMDVLIDELGETTQPLTTEVSLIYEQVYRIRSLVENLLKYSRASPLSSELQLVDVNKTIEDSLLLVRHEAVRKDANITTRFEPNCKVRIDAQELQQVFINLLLNAIHAIANRGNITITTHKENFSDVCIQIGDDGEGIDPVSIDRIFDPFYSTKGNAGTGLGLSISYGLIHRYGGSLEVDSQPQIGSIFSVHLRRDPQLSPQQKFLFDLYSHNKAKERQRPR